ncbi:hypothetical protein Tco_0263168, partial [Tanacetum coccineum]
VASSGWPFVLVVPGLMTHLIKVSSIPIVFSWGGSRSPGGFLPSIMLLVVIIVAVIIVVVTVVLVVVIGEDSSIIKLSFVIIGVSFCPMFLLVLSVFTMVAACASRAAATLSATSFLMAA